MVGRSLVLAAVLALGVVGISWADKKVEDAPAAIAVFKKIEGVAPYFDAAYGFAVFPHIGKGGLGIGAARGRGRVYRGDEITGVSIMTEVSIGLQLGGQAYRQIVFFEDERAYNDFTSGGFEFDAGAGAIAVTASAQASASSGGASATASSGGESGTTSVGEGYRKGMKIFTIGLGGLMYEVSIAGQNYRFKPLN